MNISSTLSSATEILKDAGIPDARREASSLLAFALQKPLVFLIAHPEYELTDYEQAAFESYVNRRARREPFHYITGIKEFYGLDFEVTPDVLIPRPETEMLVDESIKELSELSKLSFCEIGVGSGCISVSILHNVPHATAIATDISEKALAVAKRNAKRRGAADRLSFQIGDVFDGVIDRFGMIVSNPPYIPDADLTDMQKEVRDFEPHGALFAGTDGLDIIRRIVDKAPEHLNTGGLLLMEIGFGQAELVRELLDLSIWESPQFLPDLQGIPRILKVRLQSA